MVLCNLEKMRNTGGGVPLLVSISHALNQKQPYATSTTS